MVEGGIYRDRLYSSSTNLNCFKQQQQQPFLKNQQQIFNRKNTLPNPILKRTKASSASQLPQLYSQQQHQQQNQQQHQQQNQQQHQQQNQQPYQQLYKPLEPFRVRNNNNNNNNNKNLDSYEQHKNNNGRRVIFKNLVSVFRFDSDADSGCSGSSEYEKQLKTTSPVTTSLISPSTNLKPFFHYPSSTIKLPRKPRKLPSLFVNKPPQHTTNQHFYTTKNHLDTNNISSNNNNFNNYNIISNNNYDNITSEHLYIGDEDEDDDESGLSTSPDQSASVHFAYTQPFKQPISPQPPQQFHQKIPQLQHFQQQPQQQPQQQFQKQISPQPQPQFQQQILQHSQKFQQQPSIQNIPSSLTNFTTQPINLPNNNLQQHSSQIIFFGDETEDYVEDKQQPPDETIFFSDSDITTPEINTDFNNNLINTVKNNKINTTTNNYNNNNNTNNNNYNNTNNNMLSEQQQQPGYDISINLPQQHFDLLQEQQQHIKQQQIEEEHQQQLLPQKQQNYPHLPYSLYLQEVKNHQKITSELKEKSKPKAKLSEATFKYNPLAGSNNSLVISVRLGCHLQPNDVLVKANKNGSKLRIVNNGKNASLPEDLNEHILLPIQINPFKIAAKIDTSGNLVIEAPIARL